MLYPMVSKCQIRSKLKSGDRTK